MHDSVKAEVNDSFIVEQFGNEILLYNTVDTKALYLNETAYLVWLLCKENLTVGEMITSLNEQYPGKDRQIREDVEKVIELLEENGAVRFNDE